MLGDSGQGPISDGSGPGRIVAWAVALALVGGGAYYAWLAPRAGAVAAPAAAVLAPAPSPRAAAPVVRPSPRASYVFDQAGLLSQEATTNLNTVLAGLNTSAGPQVVVMTVPNLGGAAIDVYARRVANQWGIGDAARDDGVLLLVAPNEKQVRIEVGTGLTAVLTNSDCQEIIQTTMLPLFRQGQTERATVAGAMALTRHLAAHPTLPSEVR